MRRATLWLGVIILLAVFFRFYDLRNTPPGLWADEAMNGNNAVEMKWKVYYPENFGREGLFINIQSLFVAAFGHEPWVLRLPSTIFGILTVPGLYLMTRELFGRRIALFATFFLATSFWHIMFSRIGFRAIMAPFFLVWSFYFLFEGMRKTAVSSTPPGGKKPGFCGVSKPGFEKPGGVFPTAVFALAGLLFGLGFHTYIAYRIAPIIVLLPLWKFYQTWKIKEVEPPYGGSTSNPPAGGCAPCLIGLVVFMAIIAASPLLIYYAQNPQDFLGRTSAISIFQSQEPLAQFSENVVKTLGMFNIAGDFNWRHNLAGSPQLWWPVGILFLMGIWIAFPSSTLGVESQKTPTVFPRNACNFVLLWFVVMLLPVALSNESLPHALRAIVLIPPAMMFAAFGLEWVISASSAFLRPQLATALLFTFFLATTAHAYNTYFNRWAPNFNVYEAFQADLTEKAYWLNKQPKEIKKYVVTDSVEKVDMRGTPMSFQTIIFITNTFFERDQKEKNIYYFGANDFDRINCSGEGIIIPIESKPTIYKTLKQKIPGLRLDATPGFVVLRK